MSDKTGGDDRTINKRPRTSGSGSTRGNTSRSKNTGTNASGERGRSGSSGSRAGGTRTSGASGSGTRTSQERPSGASGSGSRTTESGSGQKPSLTKEQAAARRRQIEKKRRERARRKRNNMIIRIGIIILFVLLLLLLAKGISHLTGGSTKNDNTASQETASAKDASVSDNTDKTESSDEPGETESTEGTEEVEETPAPTPEPFKLTISTVGDITVGKDINFPYENSTNAYFDMYGSSYFMQNVKDIFAADDLTIGNFEGTLTDADNRRTDRQFCFKAPAEYANILVDGNIEVVDTANNHSHDYGDNGYEDTMRNLEAAGIIDVGYEKYAVVEVKDGHKIGVVAPYVLIEFLDCAPKMIENIQNCRNEGADVVVVVFHWGDELDKVPDYYQVTLARMAIDEGADLVVGHHAHIIQGIEKYKGRYICYGLANFCFGGNSHPTDPDSFIYQQTFTVTGDGVVYDDDINLIPILVSSSVAINNFQPTPLTGADAERVLDKIVERTEMLDTAEPQDDSYIYTHVKNRNAQ